MYDLQLYERIKARTTESPTGCWLWDGPHKNDRKYTYKTYGVMSTSINHHKARTMNVHRAMWFAVHGPIPRTVFVCHRCDTPLCCNPDHLWTGDGASNMADCIEKNRHYLVKRTHCHKGHPLSGDNLYVEKQKGYRHCRQCMKERHRRRWQTMSPEQREAIYARQRAYRAAREPSEGSNV